MKVAGSWRVSLRAEHFVDCIFERRFSCARRLLSIAPVVEDADLVNALKRAGWRTPLLSFVLTIKIGHGVVLKWYSRITTLLGAPVNQTFFADVQIARTGATTPLVRLSFGDAVLKPVETRVIFVSQLLNLLEDVFLFSRKRFERSVAVVDHADR